MHMKKCIFSNVFSLYSNVFDLGNVAEEHSNDIIESTQYVHFGGFV